MEGDSQIRVNIKQPYTAYVNRAKEMFAQHEVLSIHALGEATSSAIKASEMLVSLGYASLEKFETLTINEPDRQGVIRRQYKVILEIKKTPDFERLCEEFKNSKQTPK